MMALGPSQRALPYATGNGFPTLARVFGPWDCLGNHSPYEHVLGLGGSQGSANPFSVIDEEHGEVAARAAEEPLARGDHLHHQCVRL